VQLIFEPFVIDVDRLELRDADRRVEIEPRALELLIHLARNRDRLVTKDELHQVLWQGRFVSDAALSTLVKAARRAIGDTGRDQRFIETRYGRGFRFCGAVADADAAAPRAPPSAAAYALSCPSTTSPATRATPCSRTASPRRSSPAWRGFAGSR
jgi:DNA-binding winged helix-turn-helix (wHTH) protein